MRRDRVTAAKVLVVFLAALASRPGRPETPTPTKIEDVVRVLKAHPRATPEDLSVAGSGVDVVLTDLLVSRDVDREIRVRAAWALGGYPGSRARAVLVTTLSDREEDSGVRAAAMTGYARLVGPGATLDLKPYLKDTNPTLRIGAARALGIAGGRDARELLVEALAHEDDLDVRLAVDEALKEMK